MSRKSVTRFVGAIRLVPEVDTIGIPVFSAIKGNQTYVPEMDGDFRISKFVEFFNEQNFNITYDLPHEYHDVRYEVGTATPIPFWIAGQCHVIGGDADKNEPAKLFGTRALTNPVLSDISRLLDDARSGRISERMKEWAAENIAGGFSDVFFETPVRSRHWVARYRVAVAKARKLAQPPHPIDAKLRTVASDWFYRFGTKTDLSKLCGMLGSSRNEIFSKRQMSDIVFAFILNRMFRNEFEAVDEYIREPSLHSVFPEGLYHYYLTNGWPRVPFKYERVDDFIQRLMNALVEGADQENFLYASKLAFLTLGRGSAPEQVDSLARTFLKSAAESFRRLRDEASPIFRSRANSSEWIPYASALLDLYDAMMDLDGIINEKERLRRKPFDRRFGVTLQYLTDLKSIRKGEW